MTVALDFDWQDPAFLLPSQGVRAAGVSEPRSGCTADTLNVRASVVRGTTKVTRAASLAVVVEKSSDDGDSWSTAHTFTFTDSGIQEAEIASTPDLLRVRWTPSGGSWSSLQLEATPAATASEGGGSIPSPVTDPIVIQLEAGTPLTVKDADGDDVFSIDGQGNVNSFGDGSTFSTGYFGEFVDLEPPPGVSSSAVLFIVSADDANDPIAAQAHGSTTFQVGGEGFVAIKPSNSENFYLTGIPTDDPLVVDAVWNDAGTLKISAGPPP